LKKSAKGQTLIGELLHYFPPHVVLGVPKVYTRIAKQNNVPKLIYWNTMVAGGF
jgi:long-subunit acyl-CoA synthetase (AMP-forming)